MVDLSKSEKTKQIVKNLVDMVYAYIDEVSLVGKTIRVVKKGASAISRMASNGAAAIRSSAAAILGSLATALLRSVVALLQLGRR